MRFKMNIPVRLKNVWFWISLAGVILTAMGGSVEELETWTDVWSLLDNFRQSPRLIIGVALSILGVFIDPTTSGIGDSDQALTYQKPK